MKYPFEKRKKRKIGRSAYNIILKKGVEGDRGRKEIKKRTFVWTGGTEKTVDR